MTRFGRGGRAERAERHEHLRHDLALVRHERDAAYDQLNRLRADLGKERVRNDRLRGDNRALLARLLAEGKAGPGVSS